MKTIAMIRNSCAGDIGGAEKYPIISGTILRDRSYKVVLLSSNKTTLSMARDAGLMATKSPWSHFQNYSGCRVILLPVYVAWQTYLLTWYMLHFWRNRVDVVYPQSRDDFISASLAGIILHRRVIWSDHADLKHIYMNNKKWFKNPIGKIVYRVSKLVHVVTLESYSEKYHIEHSLGESLPKNYQVMYIGVVDSFRSALKENAGVKFVSTSRLVKDKGIAELINAFGKINDSTAELKICGDGPDAQLFKDSASQNKKIEFLGHVSNVDAVLSNADILVHPTYHEGFGLSLVEAEMHQLPIIASNVGSIPEIVEDKVSGILVPAKNVLALEKAMRHLIDRPDLRLSMGKKGRQIFLKNFQIDKIVEERLIPLIEE